MEQKHKYKKIIAAITIAIATLAMAACDGSDKGQARTSAGGMNDWYDYGPNGYRQNNCNGCSHTNAIADVLGATNTSSLKMEMGLTLYSTNQYGPNDYYSSPNKYSGSFSSGSLGAKGYMEIYQNHSYGCQLPPGSYAISTQSPGASIGLTMASGLKLMARNMQNGAVVEIKLVQLNTLQNSPVLGLDDYEYRMGFWGFAYFEVKDSPYGSCNAGQYMITTPDVSGLF